MYRIANNLSTGTILVPNLSGGRVVGSAVFIRILKPRHIAARAFLEVFFLLPIQVRKRIFHFQLLLQLIPTIQNAFFFCIRFSLSGSIDYQRISGVLDQRCPFQAQLAVTGNRQMYSIAAVEDGEETRYLNNYDFGFYIYCKINPRNVTPPKMPPLPQLFECDIFYI